MYEMYLQYGHNSSEYQELLQQKAEADGEWVCVCVCARVCFTFVLHPNRRETGGIETR